jgi:quercetin dioxygenase-like cupin family protein
MKAATIVAILGCSVTLANAGPPAKLVAFPADKLKWEPFFPGGPDEAFVVGTKQAKKGPTAFFIRFKAGFDSGWHTHESAYTGIVMSGTIIETSKGEEALSLTAGSYYVQPIVVHKTQCAAGADCLMYIYEDGKFSFTPTDDAGKALAVPKAAPTANK